MIFSDLDFNEIEGFTVFGLNSNEQMCAINSLLNRLRGTFNSVEHTKHFFLEKDYIILYCISSDRKDYSIVCKSKVNDEKKIFIVDNDITLQDIEENNYDVIATITCNNITDITFNTENKLDKKYFSMLFLASCIFVDPFVYFKVSFK